MTAMTALIKREFLEHRGAFLYAPAMLLTSLVLLIIAGIVFGDTRGMVVGEEAFSGMRLYQVGLLAVFAVWSAYLMVALFFYFADSFSADRRNNALLFWKSMPQSDLKVLASKALSGLTVFPALILSFAIISGLALYLLGFAVAARLPFVPLAGPIEMIGSLFSVAVTGVFFVVLSILWYAPFLAFVAGLSTLVQRWSIPLAFLIPGALVLVERILSFGQLRPSYPIGTYLAQRGEGFLEEVDYLALLSEGGLFAPMALIGEMFARIDWLQMVIGLIFAAVVVYAASEYRRRRIEA